MFILIDLVERVDYSEFCGCFLMSTSEKKPTNYVSEMRHRSDSSVTWKPESHLAIHIGVHHLNGTFLPVAASLVGQHRDLHTQQPP